MIISIQQKQNIEKAIRKAKRTISKVEFESKRNMKNKNLQNNNSGSVFNGTSFGKNDQPNKK